MSLTASELLGNPQGRAMTYPWREAAIAAWDRFERYIEYCPVTGCHLWSGGTTHGKGNKAPYGTFWVPGHGSVRCGVFVCVVAGKMKPGHHTDHRRTCHTLCVNLDHLEVVTPTVNSLRRWVGRRKSDRVAA